MSKHGINVPKGVAVGSVDEVGKAMTEIFPNQSEVVDNFTGQPSGIHCLKVTDL